MNTNDYNCVVVDASSSACAIQVVDNYALDFFLGVSLFMFGVWFVVWFFRKRT